jgi:hypothetical protein
MQHRIKFYAQRREREEKKTMINGFMCEASEREKRK